LPYTIVGALIGLYFYNAFDARTLARGLGALVLLALGVVRGAGYLAVGAYDREALIATAISLPLMFVGVALGNLIHTNLSEIAFRRLLSIVLMSSGVPLMLG
jgi:uncharacterized membrane protein YfcA